MTRPDAHQQISRMISGYWISQAVYVAAKLKVADLLSKGPMNCDRLAEETKTHSPSLYRLLRALASVEVFAEQSDREFSNTPLSECLRSDVPGSQWAMAVMMGEEHYETWGQLIYSIQTGNIAFDHMFGKPIFEHLAENPESAAIFDKAMTSVHGSETNPMVDAYDFSEIKTLADIGGGNGSVLAALLHANPHMRGILFDLPHVVKRAKESLENSNIAERFEFQGGDFFEAVPDGVDAFIMRHIIHDWDDEKAITILKNCHRSLPPDGKVLIVESIIPPGNEPSFAKFLDLTMLVLPGGKERTEIEFAGLLQAAGFVLSRVVETQSEVSIIEGVKN